MPSLVSAMIRKSIYNQCVSTKICSVSIFKDVVLQDFCSVLNTGNPDHDRKWFRNIFLEPAGLPAEVCDDRAAPLEKEVVTCNAPSSSATRTLACLWVLTSGLMLTGRLILF